jgi:hypothetical protein
MGVAEVLVSSRYFGDVGNSSLRNAKGLASVRDPGRRLLAWRCHGPFRQDAPRQQTFEESESRVRHISTLFCFGDAVTLASTARQLSLDSMTSRVQLIIVRLCGQVFLQKGNFWEAIHGTQATYERVRSKLSSNLLETQRQRVAGHPTMIFVSKIVSAGVPDIRCIQASNYGKQKHVQIQRESTARKYVTLKLLVMARHTARIQPGQHASSFLTCMSATSHLGSSR